MATRTQPEGAPGAGERPPRHGEWRTLAVLGVPIFGLALAITTVTTYLPVVAESFAASSVVTGLLIGGEGLVALGLPLVVGAWSDRLHQGAARPAGLHRGLRGDVAGVRAGHPGRHSAPAEG